MTVVTHPRAGLPAVDRYLETGYASVVGMSSRLAAAITCGLMRIQTELGVTGPVAEIGTFEGRFFIAMAHALQPGEKALGIDLFDWPNPEVIDRFEANCVKHGVPPEVRITWKADSRAMKAADFLAKLGGKKVEGAILAASLMLVLPEIADTNPSKKMASDYIAAYEKLNGSKPATFGANVYDAGLLLQRAIPIAAQKAKPGTKEFRAALRDALEQSKELVATQGVYTMTAADHSGFDDRGRELIVVKDGAWKLLK